jgi:molybdenum cofactor guanylyltransferase
MLRSEKFEGFVLAGGKSSRMGTDKAFLKIGEKTFLENAADVLKPACGKVHAVLNESQKTFFDKIPAGIPIIYDIYENLGALGGIHAALRECRAEFAIILACDMPYVTKESIEKLADIALVDPEADAFIPIQADCNIQPLCGIYRHTACLRHLEKFLNDGNSPAVRTFLKSINTEYIAEHTLADDHNIFRNINALSEYQEL